MVYLTFERIYNNLGLVETEFIEGFGDIQYNNSTQIDSKVVSLVNGNVINYNYLYDNNQRPIIETIDDNWLNNNSNCQGHTQYCVNNQPNGS